MARLAVFGRTIEYTVGVASFAAHVLVLRVEYKTGAAVVKLNTRLLCLRRLNGTELQHRNQQHCEKTRKAWPLAAPSHINVFWFRIHLSGTCPTRVFTFFQLST